MSLKECFTVKNVIFIILVLLVLKFISLISAIALLFFASFVIACSLNPIVDKLEKKKIKRPTAAMLVLSGTLAFTFAVFIPIIFIAIKQVQGFIKIMPEKIDLIQNFIFNHQFYGHRIPEIVNIDQIIKSSSPLATGLVNQSIYLTLNVAQGILFFLAICMIMYYFMADKTVIKNGVMRVFPQDLKEKASEIYENISNQVGGYVIAQILNMVVVGALTALGMFLLKIDYALLLGLITGVLDIIPLVGPTIALILCLLVANKLSIWSFGLVVLAFITAQWVSANLVRPIIFGKFLNLHPLVIIFALLVSAQFLGVLGVILAPAIASLVCVLFDEIYIKQINKDEQGK